MSVSSAIHALLFGDDVINQVATKGIFPSGQPKQNTAPNYLTHEIIGSERPPLLDKPCRLTNYQIQVTGYCKSEPELRRLMDSVELRLHGYKGGEIRGCQLEDTTGNANPDDPTTHSESQTYSVWHARTQLGSND